MKHKAILAVLTLFLLGLTAKKSSADAIDSLRGRYYFTCPTLLKSCGVAGKYDDHKTTLSYNEQLFDVVGFADDNANVIIEIVDYNEDTHGIFDYNYAKTRKDYDQLSQEDRDNASYGDDQLYFKISISVLQQCAKKDLRIGGALTIGALTYPFKFRYVPHLDFKGSFNFGAAIGYTFRHDKENRWQHSIMSGYSVSSITLDSSEVDRNSGQLMQVNSFSALSLAIGYVVSYDKAQAGIFVGTDILSRLNQQNFGWHFQKEPWVSIGFGFAIFTPQKETSKADESQTTK